MRAPRLRWSAPTFERDGNQVVRGYIHRLGKINGAVIDRLDKEGGAIDMNELAGALNRRARDLRRRNLPMLEEAGIVVVEDERVRLTEDWLEALNDERERAGEIAKLRLDTQRFNRERNAYAKRSENKPDEAPSERDMEAYREAWSERQAACGEIRELWRVSEPPTLKDLYALIDKAVNTTSGPGRLWQALSDRVGVVLDNCPDQVTFLHPVDVLGAA